MGAHARSLYLRQWWKSPRKRECRSPSAVSLLTDCRQLISLITIFMPHSGDVEVRHLERRCFLLYYIDSSSYDVLWDGTRATIFIANASPDHLDLISTTPDPNGPILKGSLRFERPLKVSHTFNLHRYGSLSQFPAILRRHYLQIRRSVRHRPAGKEAQKPCAEQSHILRSDPPPLRRVSYCFGPTVEYWCLELADDRSIWVERDESPRCHSYQHVDA